MEPNELEQAIDLFTGLLSAHRRNVMPNRTGMDKVEMTRLEQLYRAILSELLKANGISELPVNVELWKGGQKAMLLEADVTLQCMQSFEKNHPVVPERGENAYLRSLLVARKVILNAIKGLDA